MKEEKKSSKSNEKAKSHKDEKEVSNVRKVANKEVNNILKKFK